MVALGADEITVIEQRDSHLPVIEQHDPPCGPVPKVRQLNPGQQSLPRGQKPRQLPGNGDCPVGPNL